MGVKENLYTMVLFLVSRVGISNLDWNLGIKQNAYTKVPFLVSRVGISNFDLMFWE